MIQNTSAKGFTQYCCRLKSQLDYHTFWAKNTVGLPGTFSSYVFEEFSSILIFFFLFYLFLKKKNLCNCREKKHGHTQVYRCAHTNSSPQLCAVAVS